MTGPECKPMRMARSAVSGPKVHSSVRVSSFVFTMQSRAKRAMATVSKRETQFEDENIEIIMVVWFLSTKAFKGLSHHAHTDLHGPCEDRVGHTLQHSNLQ